MPRLAVIGTRGYPSYYGGFETAVRRLAPFLADRGWDVTVYGRPGSVREDPAKDPRITSAVTTGIDSKSLSTLSYGLTSTMNAARKKPDVALVMNVANGYWLPILKRAGVPTLVNVDGIEWDRAKWGKVAKFAFRTGAKWTARFGDDLVYDSLAIADRWSSEFGRSGQFIPYGGDPLDQQLPVEPGLRHREYILFVARFVPENSIREFFQSVPRLAKSRNVVIVGSSGYGGELDRAAQELAAGSDRVSWLGHLSDDQRLHSLWQHAGVYFHGHSVGGTNPALVQAMACGAPTVARDTVYNREVLGSSGRFVAPDPDKIVKTIESVFSDQNGLDQMSTEVRQRAASAYTWDLVNSRYEDALTRLLRVQK